MNYEYSKEIKCIKCGEQDVEISPALNGISFCECRVCGEKFIVQTDGSDTLNKYIAARQKIFALLESGENGVEVKRGLDGLVRSFPVIADIDPIYYWFKIELITRRFKNYSALAAAETEYLNIPKDGGYAVTQDDIKRSKNYEVKYARYVNGKRKKIKLIVTAALGVLCAAFIGVGLFVGVSTPTVKNAAAGVSVKLNNASYGLFGKFSVTSDIKVVESGDAEYALTDNFIKNETGKAVFYNLSLLKGGFERAPTDKVAVSVKADTALRRDRLCVYLINESGGYEEVAASVSADNTVVFKTDRLGLFAVAEKPFVVSFDTAGGNDVKTQKIEWGKTASISQGENSPEKTGYTFGGWFNGNSEYDFTSPVIADIALTARWTANKYNVSYYADGVLVHTQQVTFDENTELRVSDKRGYSVEWYNGETAVKSGEWNIADDTRLDARWIPLTYSVALNDVFMPCCEAEAAGDVSVKATFGSTLPTVKVPKRTGYTLEGYYTKSGGEGEKYIDGAGNGVGGWNEDKDCTLYANWVKAEKYEGYKFITSASELFAISQNTGGKYLLTRDIDLQGATWTPLSFGGVLDGGYHGIYNYKIKNGYVAGRDKNFGFFGILTGTVKNLQIGKEGYTTSVKYDDWHWKLHAGVIAGFSTGNVSDCRVVNCSVDVKTFAQDNTYYGQEFYVNAAGICGVQRGGAIERCLVVGSTVKSNAQSRYNGINGMARAGGIIGYAADGCKVSNCYVTASVIDAYAKACEGAMGNQTGAPFSRAGGIAAEALGGAVFTVCAINKSIGVNSNIEWDYWWVGNGGNKYWGAMFGMSDGTNLSNLIGVSSLSQCSGTTGNSGYATIGNDSVTELIAKNAAFNNGYWIGDNGKVALKFYD